MTGRLGDGHGRQPACSPVGQVLTFVRPYGRGLSPVDAESVDDRAIGPNDRAQQTQLGACAAIESDGRAIVQLWIDLALAF